ncbi:hypothetical protein GCM10010441_69960 [Kitasatospora paracochleata]|uniref:Uncharacterized protein n=1 Tax=Kitasatospora paracochleata TaxID=58354 RepID=A0ABT1JA58_9ACTN|nr:hypothetical protein [Kitasatospora paracochleata]MCP2314345.1 hypothetical protein [Kitasatospora paracochleata]
MFDRLRVEVVPEGQRWPGQVRIEVNGRDVAVESVGEDACGLFLAHLFPVGAPSPLRATVEPRRVRMGEPDCTGGCCGYLSVVVQRIGGIVEWSEWQVPYEAAPLPWFHLDADRYDAVVRRVEAELSGVGAPGS